MNKFIIFSFVVTAFFLVRCGNNSENRQSKQVDSLAKVSSQTVAEAEKIIKSFPTPFEVTQLLNKAGASYILDISNPPGNIDKYTTMERKAMNLGIYGADLCYAVTYNKKQETTNYLEVIQKLSDKIEIGKVYDKSTTDRINKNFDKKDSIVGICTNQFTNSNNTLIKSGRSNVSTLSISGGVIEGLYISTMLASFAKDNSGIKKVISDQKSIFKKLLLLLSQYKDDKEIQSLSQKLKDIDSIFDSINGTMSDQQLKDLSTKIEAIRKDLIK